MTQKIIERWLQHKVPNQIMRISRVTELVKDIILENPGYYITSSIVVPDICASKFDGTTILNSIVGYKCSFILTEGNANQIVIEKRLSHNSDEYVDFSEVSQLTDNIISENPGYTITSSIVIEKKHSDLIGNNIFITKTVGYDCCFILTQN